MHRMHQSDLTPLNLQISKVFAINWPLILTQSVLLMNHKTIQSHTDCFLFMLLFVFPIQKLVFPLLDNFPEECILLYFIAISAKYFVTYNLKTGKNELPLLQLITRFIFFIIKNTHWVKSSNVENSRTIEDKNSNQFTYNQHHYNWYLN